MLFAREKQKYSQKIRILAKNGTMLAPRHPRKFEAHPLLQILGGNTMARHTLNIFSPKYFFKVEISPQVYLLRSPLESIGRRVRT